MSDNSHLNTIRLLMAAAMVPGDRKLIGGVYLRLREAPTYSALMLHTRGEGFRVDFFVSGNVCGMTVKGSDAVAFMTKVREGRSIGVNVWGLDDKTYTFTYHETPSYQQLKLKLSREGVVFAATKEGRDQKTKMIAALLAKLMAHTLPYIDAFNDSRQWIHPPASQQSA